MLLRASQHTMTDYVAAVNMSILEGEIDFQKSLLIYNIPDQKNIGSKRRYVMGPYWDFSKICSTACDLMDI